MNHNYYNFILLGLIVVLISCATSMKTVSRATTDKLEIIKTDSTRDYYVFNTKNNLDSEIIVLAEKDKFIGCQPFKKFIISDSIHQTSVLKSGSHKDFVGFYVHDINGIKIRNEGELVKIITNCNCFSK